MNQLLDAEQVFREVPSSQQRVVICSPRVSKHWQKWSEQGQSPARSKPFKSLRIGTYSTAHAPDEVLGWCLHHGLRAARLVTEKEVHFPRSVRKLGVSSS